MKFITRLALSAVAPLLLTQVALADGVNGAPAPFDVILVGDLFYERPLAERLLAWLAPLPALVLLGDPGRSYFPKSGVEKRAAYQVPTTRDLEDREIRDTGVYRLTRA